MSTEDNAADQRALPRFFTEWRALWGTDGADFTPVDYLNQQEGLPFVLAAQWLFCPAFMEYRGCVIMAHRFDKEILDQWFAKLGDDLPRIEAIANLVTLADLFTACDLDPYEEDLSQLARTLAQCWESVLRLEYPDREFVVEVYDDERSNGPEVTFYTRR